MNRFNLILATALAAFLGVASASYGQEKSPQKKEVEIFKAKEQSRIVYSCPMHPEVTSDKPGKCPKCGMSLEKVESTESPKQSDEEMATTCALMCETMMKNPSMMKKMHLEMMEGIPSDSSRMDMSQMGTMKSCCGKRH